MNYKRVEYEIINRDNGTSILLNDTAVGSTFYPPPRNWDESETTIIRNLETFGVITMISRDLEFVKEGANFLRGAYLTRDIEAQVDLIEYRFNPNTDVRYIHSTGTFDFSEYVSEKTFVNIPFKSGGLNALVQSKLKEKFELERTESLNGLEIDELIKQTVALTSRNILLVSQLKTNPEDSLIESFRIEYTNPVQQIIGHTPIPCAIVFRSDEIVASQVPNLFETTFQGNPAGVFYFNNDVDKTLSVSISGTFQLDFVEIDFDQIVDDFLEVQLAVYDGGENLDNVPSKRVVILSVADLENSNGQTFDFSYSADIDVLVGESLGVEWTGGGVTTPAFNGAKFEVNFSSVDCTIDISEDSIRANSQTQAVLMKDVGEKLMQIITGEKNKYISDFFNNSDFKLSAVSLGLWIRQFFDKNIEISLESFFNNSNSLFLMGFTIDKIDGTEKLIHENIDYFFQDFVSVELTDRVTDVKRSALSEEAYTSIKMGYKKPSGDNLYEEAQGLDEPNILNSYNTPITRVDNVYDKASDFRADSYGKEFARRKSIETNPTDDTRYDKTIFVLDLKEGDGDALEERTWEDDFEQLPTGVYSPETITGLRLSPINTLLRHGKYIRSFLNKFVSEFITFSNSVGNQLLTTKPIGGAERSENSPVQIEDFDYPLFTNEVIEFKSKVTFEINQQIYGRTQVGDRSVPNFFGKVRFINEFGNKEEGYLLELSPLNEGNWKLIKRS